MKTRFLPHLGLRQQQHLLQALLLLVLAIPCIALATWLWGKHQSWQNNLQRQEAMYARLTGIQAQQTDIALALEQAQQQASLYLFPAEGEPEATATAALQQLRQAIDGIGVKVTSSQIKLDLQEDEAQPYQRLQLLHALDGAQRTRQMVFLPPIRLNAITRQEEAFLHEAMPKGAGRTVVVVVGARVASVLGERGHRGRRPERSAASAESSAPFAEGPHD